MSGLQHFLQFRDIPASTHGEVGASAALAGKLLRELADDAARLVAGGIPLYRLEPHEPSLTDAYFALQSVGKGSG